MYKRIFTMVFTLFFLQFVQAQSSDSTGIIVHKNSRLDELMKKQFVGSTAKTTTSQVKLLNYRVRRQGYRILVLNTNDRNLTYKTKGQLLGRYPDQQLYIAYQAPFFKLKLGDFTSRNEAEKLKGELSKIVQREVFIIHDVVMVKVEDQAKL